MLAPHFLQGGLQLVLGGWIEEKAGGMKDREDPLLKLAGIAEDAAGDISENTDAYLYGDKSRDSA